MVLSAATRFQHPPSLTPKLESRWTTKSPVTSISDCSDEPQDGDNATVRRRNRERTKRDRCLAIGNAPLLRRTRFTPSVYRVETPDNQDRGRDRANLPSSHRMILHLPTAACYTFPNVVTGSSYLRRINIPPLSSLLLPATFASAGNILKGTVFKIADGDTITVLDSNKKQHSIRIAVIDAPEKGQSIGNRDCTLRRRAMAAREAREGLSVELPLLPCR